ncbi:4-(cytidine 5'-diphospho)-2-C-methyl-D-erythritol kinase [Candidatus Peregrinibacteria bacterium]|nr:4-(cytidine 5'-diphospho)-2-C-methyl-D-erythritol kinase [Candidatus Peregrinibacteria bacterium]
MIAKDTQISILSYPKINLALDILGKTPSGYHEIQTVFHQLKEPVDEIILENREDGILEVTCDNPKVPLDETNTVLKAVRLLKKYLGALCLGAKIFIRKRIPLMSGLGGGASNAVAALKGLAELREINCCTARDKIRDKHAANCILRKIADQIGMDCQFFFDGGTALGSHFGEKITPLPALPPEIKFEIIETGIEISSHQAYNQIDLNRCGKNFKKTKALIAAIRASDPKNILENLHNDFEEFIFEKYPRLVEKKREIELKNSASCIMLCGSGGCLFNINCIFH